MSNTYVCVEVHHKYGAYSFNTFNSDKEIKAYCLDKLEDYDEVDEAIRKYSLMSLDDLIEFTIFKGKKNLEEQREFGLVRVIKGDNIVQYSDTHNDE